MVIVCLCVTRLFCFIFLFILIRPLLFSFELFYIVISGSFTADYLVWALLIVEGHTIVYNCIHPLHLNFGLISFYTTSPFLYTRRNTFLWQHKSVIQKTGIIFGFTQVYSAFCRVLYNSTEFQHYYEQSLINNLS